MKEVRSPWSSKSSRADSVPEQGTASRHSEEPRPTALHVTEADPEPLPPLSEEPSVEEPQAAADSELNTAGSGADLGCPDPKFLRQFEELLGRRVFSPDVAGSALGVVGPED
jgi:hypothetical protein